MILIYHKRKYPKELVFQQELYLDMELIVFLYWVVAMQTEIKTSKPKEDEGEPKKSKTFA